MEYQGPEERMVQRGRRVASDPLVSSDHLDWLERRYNLFNQDLITLLALSNIRLLMLYVLFMKVTVF